MHMDEGIGRTGYRLLAFLWTALGFLGAAALWLGIEAGLPSVLYGGFGLLAISLAVLFAFTWLTPNEPRQPARAQTRGGERRRWFRFGRDKGPTARSAPPAAAAPSPAPAAGPPSGGLDFEFRDAVPAADAAPEQMVLPDAFSDPGPEHAGPHATMTVRQEARFQERDPAAWPGQKNRGGQSTWTTERKALEGARRKAETRPVHKDLAQKYTRNAPMVRDILAGNDARPAAPPGGKTRGKCGDCGTVILAPPQRPIRLRCPKCSKVTLLKA